MKHTEESLMALFYSAADAIHDSLRDDGGIQIAEGLVAKGMIDALRLAIREVLAERDRYLDIIRREAWLEHAAENDVASPYVPFTDWVAEKNRAEKAEAELAVYKDAKKPPLEQSQSNCLAWMNRYLNAEAECERLRAERQGKIDENPGHEYWLTASHDEILDALRFQGAMTKVLIPYQNECERLRKDAERWKGLRKLAGFVEDGSNETVRLYQDDATKDWFVSVGKCNWFGSSLSAAIDAAIKDQP